MGIEQLSTIWPEWSVVGQIGKGSFGEVFKVEREERGFTDYAAVKVISIPKSDDEISSLRADGYDELSIRSYLEGIVTDFVSEIKLMASMKGTANIVSIEDYKVVESSGKIGWNIFIRMELLTPFNEYVSYWKMTETEVIKLGTDICSALELCSKKKIIHRDIKPENIFVSSFGDFKVGDFGVARELEKTVCHMSTKGSYHYMAPEVKVSKMYDATVDIYSLGLVLYKLLNNNRLPFLDPYAQMVGFQERQDAIERRLGGEALPVPVEASVQMSQVILKACAYNPAERYKTATEFKAALGALKTGETLHIAPPVPKTSQFKESQTPHKKQAVPVSSIDADETVRARRVEADVDDAGSPGKKISIKGIQYDTSITRLDVREKGLTDEDILPLKYMTNLTTLILDDNQISDLLPLSGLTKLEKLFLQNNKINDISPLKGMVNLKCLYLTNTQISDISPLSGLTNLEDLWISGYQINDISILHNLTNLKTAYISGNFQDSDILSLLDMTNLEQLCLWNRKKNIWERVRRAT